VCDYCEPDKGALQTQSENAVNENDGGREIVKEHGRNYSDRRITALKGACFPATDRQRNDRRAAETGGK